MKKTTSLNESTLFKQIVREEYVKAKVQYICESHRKEIRQLHERMITKSRVNPEYITKYGKFGEHKWANATAQAVLANLKAKPYALGLKPAGMELDIYQDGTLQDRMQFYSDGDVYSSEVGTTLGWKLKGNTITIYESPSSATVLGTLKLIGGKVAFIDDPAAKTARKEKEAEKKDAAEYTTGEKVIDNIQSVLDWAGLVPVIGDALDLVNAVIYGIRGKWWDCLFSAIGIIPVVGSVISLSVKSGWKALKGVKKIAGSADEIAMGWKMLIDNKILKKGEIAAINNGFKALSKQAMNVKLWFKKQGPSMLGDDATELLMDGLDEFDGMLKSVIEVNSASGKYGSKLATDIADKSARTAMEGSKRLGNAFFTRASKKEVDDALVGLGKEVADNTVMNVGWIRRNAAKLTGPIKKIFQSSKVSKEVADVMKNGLEAKFKKQFSDPTNLTVLFKTSLNNPAIVKELSETWAKKFGDLTTAAARGQFAAINSALKAGDARYIKNLLEKASKGDVAGLGIPNVKPDTILDWYKGAQQTLLKSATDMKNPSIFFSAFINDEMNILKSYINRHLTSDKSLISQYITSLVPSAQSFAKRLDIWTSEIQDALEVMGVQEDTEKNGFIVTWLSDTLVKNFPKIFDPKQSVLTPLLAPAKAVVKTGAETIGIDTEKGYDPKKQKEEN